MTDRGQFSRDGHRKTRTPRLILLIALHAQSIRLFPSLAVAVQFQSNVNECAYDFYRVPCPTVRSGRQ